MSNLHDRRTVAAIRSSPALLPVGEGGRRSSLEKLHAVAEAGEGAMELRTLCIAGC